MKSVLKIFVPAFALVVISGPAIRAQDQAAPLPSDQPLLPPGGPGANNHGKMDPAQHVQRLDAALTLTDDQKSTITEIYKKAHADIKACRSGGGTPEENRAKVQDIQKSVHAQVRAVLTTDQQQKFDALPTYGPDGQGAPNDATPQPPPAPSPEPSK